MGTVFPLVAEALNGDRLSVGGPYFDRMTMPVGFLLLFLMAVAPVLPWRKASGELLRQRLLRPGVGRHHHCGGRRRPWATGARPPCSRSRSARFVATAVLRQLVLSARRSRAQGSGAWRGLMGRRERRDGRAPRRGGSSWWPFAASHSYRSSGEFPITPGRSAVIAGPPGHLPRHPIG